MKKLIKKLFSNALLNLLIGFMVGISCRYLVDWTYEMMRREGLTPKLPYVHTNIDGSATQTDVYLIPFEGFPESAASDLSRYLSHDLNLMIKSTGCIPLPHDGYDPFRDQYISNNLYRPIADCVPKLIADPSHKTIFIGLLKEDMYLLETNWNFCFCAHFENGVSVVAGGRLPPYGVFNKNRAREIYGARLVKLIKRTIGIQYYNYPRTDNTPSVMYAPLMSLDDLDRMGSDF